MGGSGGWGSGLIGGGRVVARLEGGIGLVFVSWWWIGLLRLLVEFGRRLCVGGGSQPRVRRGGVRLRMRLRKVCRYIRQIRGVLVLGPPSEEKTSGRKWRPKSMQPFRCLCSFRGRGG